MSIRVQAQIDPARQAKEGPESSTAGLLALSQALAGLPGCCLTTGSPPSPAVQVDLSRPGWGLEREVQGAPKVPAPFMSPAAGSGLLSLACLAKLTQPEIFLSLVLMGPPTRGRGGLTTFIRVTHPQRK